MYTFTAVNGETLAYKLEQYAGRNEVVMYTVFHNEQDLGYIVFKDGKWYAPQVQKVCGVFNREQAVKMVFYKAYPRLMES